LCAIILLAVSIVVYSPLHRDDPQAGGVCPFCYFQNLGFELAQSQIHFDVPAPVVWYQAETPPASYSRWIEYPHLGRAPPSSLAA